MQSEANQKKGAPKQNLTVKERKLKYEQIGVNFKTHGQLAIGIGLLSAIQQQIQSSFDKIDVPSPILPSPDLLVRSLTCAQKNQKLLLGVLRIKEELIGRMYMGRQQNKANETTLSALLTNIRTAKISINDHLHELRVRRIALTSRPRPFQQEHRMQNEDLNMLRNGLEVLQKETFELWNELSSYAPPITKSSFKL